MDRILVTAADNGRVRVHAPDGRAWTAPGPMVPTPHVRRPASAIVGPARRTVEWARRDARPGREP